MCIIHTGAYNKDLLSNQQTKIGGIFDQFKTYNNYMAVYFTHIDKPFITFKSTNNFIQEFRMSSNLYCLGFVYDTSGDFSTQTATFLS